MKRWTQTEVAAELQRAYRATPQTEDEKEYLFLLCLRLAEMKVVGCRYCDNKEEENEFAFVIAEELYMAIVTGKYVIREVIGFLDYMMPQYCGIYYKLKGWKKPESNASPKYFDPNHAQRISPMPVNEIIDKISTGNLVKDSWDALHKFARYYKWENKVASRNAHLSLVMSIRRGKFVSYHLGNRDERVCRLLYNRYKLLLGDIVSAASKQVISDSDYLQSVANTIYQSNGLGEEQL